MGELLKDFKYVAVLKGCEGPYLHYADVNKRFSDSIYEGYRKVTKPNTKCYDHDHSLLSSPRDSHYHDSCLPKKPPTLPSSKPQLTDAQLRKADAVSQDKVWKQSVENEQKGLQKWENAWGFLTEYDARGNPIEKTTLPESYAQKNSGPVPITNSRQYGARIGTQQGQTMLSLEFQLSKGNKKRKLDSEMICY